MKKEKKNQPLIQLTDVKFSVDKTEIIKGIDLEIAEGEFIYVTGPSGSGKSTLLKLIASLISPTAGTIHYRGVDQQELDFLKYRQEVSYFFQNAELFGRTVRDNLAFPAEIREERPDVSRMVELLEAVNLSESYLDEKISELSGGEKQRVAFVRNMMYPPKVLLLDEVTSSLDEENRKALTAYIRRLNREEHVTVLWITHFSGAIEPGSRQVEITEGSVSHDGTISR